MQVAVSLAVVVAVVLLLAHSSTPLDASIPPPVPVLRSGLYPGSRNDSGTRAELGQPLCSTRGGPKPGSWVDRGPDFSAQLDPPCCAWDRRRELGAVGNEDGAPGIRPQCTMVNVAPDVGFSGSTAALIPVGGYACNCSPERQRAMQRFEWTPRDCALPVWDARAFCAALGNRTVLFIGDSTGMQLAAAVHNYIAWSGEACGVQLSAQQSGPYLDDRHGGRSWFSIVKAAARLPDIVVLGAGAFVKPLVGIAGVLNTVRAEYKLHFGGTGLRVVWRTSLGGGCTKSGGALEPLLALPRDSPGFWKAHASTENFEKMEEWDLKALGFWQDDPFVALLDLTPLWMRPDAKQGSGEAAPWNCHHTCVPGALRLAARQLLLLFQTELRVDAQWVGPPAPLPSNSPSVGPAAPGALPSPWPGKRARPPRAPPAQSAAIRALPLCSVRGGPTPGAWVDLGEALEPWDPPCCSWDRRRRVLFEADGGVEEGAPCGFDGLDMSRGGTFRGSNITLLPAGGFACQCSPERLRAMQRFEWTPHECRLPVWDAHAFCAALGSRRVLFIGDSTGQQLSATIHNYVTFGGAACGPQLLSELSDTLIGEHFGVLNRGSCHGEKGGNHQPGDGKPPCTFLDLIEAVRPDIVVMGAAAHIKHTVGTPAIRKILAQVREDVETRLSGSTVRIVWRTSLGAGCLVEGDVLAPMAAHPRDTPGAWEHINATQKLYNFQLMEEWDRIALDFWKDHPRVSTLDITPLWMRPDSMQGAGQVDPCK